MLSDPDVRATVVEALRYADMTLADLRAARDKGYIPHAQRIVRDALAILEEDNSG